MKSLKVVLAIILSMSLLVGFAFPVMAKPDKPDKEEAKSRVPAIEVLTGNVTAVDPGKTFFWLQQRNQQPVQITVDNQTQYYILYVPRKVAGLNSRQEEKKEKNPNAAAGRPQSVPGPAGVGTAMHAGGQRATFDDLSIGDRVSVRVARGTRLAKQVIIMEPVFRTVNGTITAINTTDNTTTIQPLAGGAPLTVKWNKNTVVTIRGAIAVAVGQHARIVYRVKNMTATSIRILPPPRPTPLVVPPTSERVAPGRRSG